MTRLNRFLFAFAFFVALVFLLPKLVAGGNDPQWMFWVVGLMMIAASSIFLKEARNIERQRELKSEELNTIALESLRKEVQSETQKNLSNKFVDVFKNHLMSILGQSQLARVEEGGDQYLKVEEEIRKARQVLEKITYFSGEREISIEPTQLFAVIESSLMSFKTQIEDLGIQVERKWNDRKVEVYGDFTSLHMAFKQIFQNAIEALEEVAERNLTVSVSLEGDNVEVIIEDSGIGSNIGEEVFQPFSGTREQGHLGLGLTACKTVIDQHEGKIRFLSTPGSGTQIMVTLPIVQLAQEETQESESIQFEPVVETTTVVSDLPSELPNPQFLRKNKKLDQFKAKVRQPAVKEAT